MSTIPKAPISPAPVVTALSPPLAPADVARFVDMMSNWFNFDTQIHPDDLTELRTIAARIRNSSNQ